MLVVGGQDVVAHVLCERCGRAGRGDDGGALEVGGHEVVLARHLLLLLLCHLLLLLLLLLPHPLPTLLSGDHLRYESSSVAELGNLIRHALHRLKVPLALREGRAAVGGAHERLLLLVFCRAAAGGGEHAGPEVCEGGLEGFLAGFAVVAAEGAAGVLALAALCAGFAVAGGSRGGGAGDDAGAEEG